jgi:hypothetical protein
MTFETGDYSLTKSAENFCEPASCKSRPIFPPDHADAEIRALSGSTNTTDCEVNAYEHEGSLKFLLSEMIRN